MFYTTNQLNDILDSLTIINPNKYNRRSRQYETETTDDGVTLTIETPGYNKNLINVSVEDELLIVEGKSNSGNLNGFKEKFTLSDKFDGDDIEAKIVDGILTVNVPFKEETKPRKVKVKVG
jgi:HSP20 family molecular chaperone IbpA